MEIVTNFVNNQFTLYIPVVLVIVVVILVFTFGFQSAEQPPFDKLSNDDRKQAGKKRKPKEKKTTANGNIPSADNKSEKSPVKDAKPSPAKDVPDVQKQKDKKAENKLTEKNRKNEAIKNKTMEEVKTKKLVKKLLNEKPSDFDDGNWETVLSKADKKKKTDQSPVKKDKKSKKNAENKAVEIEKLVKEVVNEVMRGNEKEVKVEKLVEEPPKVEEAVVEEKKDKKKEKKPKKEKEEQATLEKEIAAVKPKVEKIKAVIKEEAIKAPPKEGAAIFDELGDVWTEAKAAKKSKKKTRRDN